MQSINKKQCTLCSKSDPEIISIISSIQQKLYRLLQKPTFSSSDQYQNSNGNNGNFHGFSRLIRVVFLNKFKHLKANNNCRHQDIKRNLAKKLKCSLNVLNLLCDQLAGILGKFNFHIDVLIQQMKSFQRYLKTDKNQNQQINSTKDVLLNNQNIQNKQNNFLKIRQNSQIQQDQCQKIQKRTKIQQNQYLISNNNIPTFETYSQIDMSFIPNQYYPSMNYMWYYQGQAQ